jgi:hypothetical protein
MVKFGRGDPYLGIIISSVSEICPAAQPTNQQDPAGLSGVAVGSAAAQHLFLESLPGAGYREHNNYSSLVELDETLSALEGMLALPPQGIRL